MKTAVRFVWITTGALLSVAATAPNPAALKRTAAVTNFALSAKSERIAPDRAKLVIAPSLDAKAKLKLLDNDGKEIPAAIGQDGSLQAEVDPRKSYIVSQDVASRRPLAADGLHFPARYVTFANNGATNLGGLFLRPARMPLTWDEATKSYMTELFVGYEFQDGAERPLASPKTVTLFAEGANARIRSDSVVISRSGGSGYQRVTLTTADYAGETQFTARAGPADEIKSSVTVHREPGVLKLNFPSATIPAFGVGSGKLSVSLLARDGAPLPAEQAMEVQLSSDHLRLPPSVIIPAGSSSAEVDFRSNGYGPDQVHAQTGLLSSMHVIRLVFPIAAVVAAVAGGALGGGARYVRNKKQRSRLLARRVGEGVLVGVIFVAAAWAGLVVVDVSTGILGTPFGAFTLAALSGYLGCVVLDRVAGRAFKGLEPQKAA